MGEGPNFKQITEFEWDKGNRDKNLIKHKVTNQECEEVFFDTNKKIFKDLKHSLKEPRQILIGKTKSERFLFIIFTARKNKIRIISSRDLNKRERKMYEERN